MPRANAAPLKRLSREEQKVLRHRQILEATWDLFCEHGYESLKIDQVAERAGVSRMPVYYAFGDKQNLFLELWRSEVEKVLETVDQVVREGAPLRDNLSAIAELTAEGHRENSRNPGENLFFVVQTIALSREDIDQKLTSISNGIIQMFEGVIKQSKLGKNEKLRGNPQTLAAYLFGIINGLSTVRFQTGMIDVKQEDLLDIMLSIVLDVHP